MSNPDLTFKLRAARPKGRERLAVADIVETPAPASATALTESETPAHKTVWAPCPRLSSAVPLYLQLTGFLRYGQLHSTLHIKHQVIGEMLYVSLREAILRNQIQ